MKFLPFIISLLAVCLSWNTKAGIIVTNGLTHRHQVQPASAQSGVIVLKNVGRKAKRFVVYFQDLPANCEGQELQIAAPGSTPRSNANWISVEVLDRVMAPGEEFPLKYEVNTPDSSLKGSYWSLLMIEVKNPIDTGQAERGIRISSNVRYAIQIITDFASAEEAKLSFNSVELNKANGKKFIEARLFNEGGVVLLPDLKLELYDEEGILLFESHAKKKKLYPGQCKSFSIPLEKLNVGSYQAVIVADCGNSNLFGVTINLNVDDD